MKRFAHIRDTGSSAPEQILTNHNLEKAGKNVLKNSGINSDEIELLIPHQANLRIIESTAKKLAIPPVLPGVRQWWSSK